VVGQDADVRERPSEDIGQDEDGGLLGVASNVSLLIVQRRLLAGGLTIPLEAGLAVVAGHGGGMDMVLKDCPKAQLRVIRELWRGLRGLKSAWSRPASIRWGTAIELPRVSSNNRRGLRQVAGPRQDTNHGAAAVHRVHLGLVSSW
jgi:hypothetical protein